MGIAEQGDARWRQTDARLQRFNQVRFALTRQAVHKVETHVDLCPAQPLNRRFHHLDRLHAPDGLLDMRRKGLDAQIDPRNADLPHGVDPRPVEAAGIDFDR